MMLVRCIYASRVNDVNTSALRKSIMASSRRHNPELGVTGILVFAGDYFIQILEGGRDHVCQLYNKIAQDPRHTHVTLMVFEEIEKRSFEGWAMGEVPLDQVNPAVLLKYSATRKLEPFQMTGSSMLHLLQELVASGSVNCGPQRA